MLKVIVGVLLGMLYLLTMTVLALLVLAGDPREYTTAVIITIGLNVASFIGMGLLAENEYDANLLNWTRYIGR